MPGPTLDYITPDLRPLAVSVEDLTTDPRNARAHSRASIDGIKASLERWKQRKPIVVRRDPDTGDLSAVAAGNGTLTAARELGWTHIAAVVVEEGAPEAQGFALSDNRTAELSTWGELAPEILAEVRVDLPDIDFDALGLDAGFEALVSPPDPIVPPTPRRPTEDAQQDLDGANSTTPTDAPTVCSACGRPF